MISGIIGWWGCTGGWGLGPGVLGADCCGNCLTSNEKNKQGRTKKKNILYIFGYSIGRGVQVLKERSKVKWKRISHLLRK